MVVGVAVEAQISAILRDSTAVIEAMRLPGEPTMETQSRIVAQPLKRAGQEDPEVVSNDPTPQCFDPFVPYWLRPSIAVVMGIPVGASTGREARYMVGRYTLAYYAGPDVSDVVLWQVRGAAAAALDGATVWFPDGLGARLRVTHDLTSIVSVPEFPGAGDMLMERVSAIAVWRRA